MNLIYYLLEANVYLMVFYGLYKLMFQHITFHQLNRCFLLGSVFLAFGMPLIDFSGLFSSSSAGTASFMPAKPEVSLFPALLFGLYITGILVMTIRFALRLKALYALLKKGEVIQGSGYKLVLLSELDQAFSFMNYLFLNPRLRDSEVILIHEQVHIRQGHSMDLLFMDLVQSLCWFNPFIGIIRNELKIIHEYIADEETTAKSIDTPEYAMFLIRNTYPTPASHLGSNMFNQSNLKKRIMKLSQKKSASLHRLRYLAAAGLVPLMMGITSLTFAKSYALIRISQNDTAAQDTIKKQKNAVPVKAKKVSPAAKPATRTTGSNSKDIVKYPPPIVRSQKSPPAPKKAVKVDKVKFPPPVIAPPPPPVDPAKGKAGKSVEAPPPPPVQPRAKSGQSEDAPPPPPMPPKKKN